MGFPDSATLEQCYWRQDTARWNPGLLPEFARLIRFTPSGLRVYIDYRLAQNLCNISITLCNLVAWM